MAKIKKTRLTNGLPTSADTKALLAAATIFKDPNFLNHVGYFAGNDEEKDIAPRVFSDQLTFNGKEMRLDYKITPDPRFGFPGDQAYRVKDYFDLSLSLHGMPARNPIFFDMVTLRKILGLTNTGPNNNAIRRAIEQLRHTEITTSFYNLGRGNFIETSFRVIDSITRIGEQGEVKGGLVYLSEPIITSYNNSLRVPLNHARYSKVRNAKAKRLFGIIFRIFSISQKKDGKPFFSKDYESLCVAFGIAVYTQRSRIMHQMKRYMDVLAAPNVALIKSWDIVPNKQGRGFNLVAEPGKGFKEDYASFQIEIPFDRSPKPVSHGDDIKAAEMAMYFAERRLGVTRDEHITNQEDVNRAKEIIEKLPTGTEPRSFIDWALERAAEDRFEPKFVSGLKNYLDRFLVWQAKQGVKKIEAARSVDMETAENTFYQFLTHVFKEYLASRKNEAQKEIKEQLHQEATRIPVVSKEFNERGEDSMIYRQNLGHQERIYAIKFATSEKWESFLEGTGASKSWVPLFSTLLKKIG